jgi:hypothetical protein
MIPAAKAGKSVKLHDKALVKLTCGFSLALPEAAERHGRPGWQLLQQMHQFSSCIVQRTICITQLLGW